MTEPSSPPETELSELRAQLAELLVQQSTVFSNWVKFAITVQGGLAAGLGAVLFSTLAKYWLFGLIIALSGVATAALFARILVRQTQWIAWYLRRGRELASTPEIFPREDEIPVRWPKWKDQGPVMQAILIFLAFVAIAWVVVFVLLIRLDTEALPPNPSFKTWNNCPLNYTVQGGMCKPYRGP
jgi:hypothetical protein